MRDTSYMLFFYDLKIYVRTQVKITGQWKSMPFLSLTFFHMSTLEQVAMPLKPQKEQGVSEKGGDT